MIDPEIPAEVAELGRTSGRWRGGRCAPGASLVGRDRRARYRRTMLESPVPRVTPRRSMNSVPACSSAA